MSFGNLEVPLTTSGIAAEKAATHRADPNRVTDLREMGVDVVTLANNHMLDYGVEGLRDTIVAVESAGLGHVGAGENAAEARRPLLHPTPTGMVAFVGLCAALPPGFAATADRPGVAPLRVMQQHSMDPVLAAEQPGMAPFVHTQAHGPDLEAACDAVRSARESADLLVVGVHWGVPFGFAAASYGPLAEYQRPSGHALVDAGADLVLGHHPHMVQPIEVYGGAVIAYSVGNYAFHNWDAFGPGATSSEEDIPDDGFLMAVPAAPYRSPFDAPETLDSVVIEVPKPRDGSSRVVRFVPTTMVDGDPVVPDEERSRAILRRLVKPRLEAWDGGSTPALTVRQDVHDGMTVGEVTCGPRD